MAGWRPFARAVAGSLPFLTILSIVVSALVIDALQDLRAHPDQNPVSLQVVKFALLLATVAAAQTLGMLPFLRDRRELSE